MEQEVAGDLDRLVQAGRSGVQIGVAESLTSGLLCSELGRAEAASAWFAGGVVAYSTAVKEKVLGLAPGVDPCSPECAEQLANGARELFGCDVAVSTTGVGGPDPKDGHDPGTVYVGWATAGGTGHRLLRLEGSPEQVVHDTIRTALSVLARLAHADADAVVGGSR